VEEKTSDATGPGGTVVGLRPWLPWPLSRSPWWAAPVPAQRLAALRIGLGLVLLLDVLLTYAPYAHDFYGRGSLGAPPLFGWRFPLYPFNTLGQHLTTVFRPVTLAGELLGGAVLAWDWRRSRRAAGATPERP